MEMTKGLQNNRRDANSKMEENGSDPEVAMGIINKVVGKSRLSLSEGFDAETSPHPTLGTFSNMKERLSDPQVEAPTISNLNGETRPWEVIDSEISPHLTRGTTSKFWSKVKRMLPRKRQNSTRLQLPELFDQTR